MEGKNWKVRNKEGNKIEKYKQKHLSVSEKKAMGKYKKKSGESGKKMRVEQKMSKSEMFPLNLLMSHCKKNSNSKIRCTRLPAIQRIETLARLKICALKSIEKSWEIPFLLGSFSQLFAQMERKMMWFLQITILISKFTFILVKCCQCSQWDVAVKSGRSQQCFDRIFSRQFSGCSVGLEQRIL